MKRFLLIALIVGLFATINNTYAQYGFGTASPNPNAVIDMTSTKMGLLIPRVALQSATDNTTIPVGSAENSMIVYNTNASGISVGFYYWYYNAPGGSKWVKIDDAVTAMPFNMISSGTNTTATMTVSTGASIIPDNTNPGIIKANDLVPGTVTDEDVNTLAAIAGTKINPNFGSQAITTSGNISTTNGGTLTVSGTTTLASLLTNNGIVQTNGSGVLSSSTSLPNGTTATTQTSGDNSTKIATTQYVTDAVSTANNNLAGSKFITFAADPNLSAEEVLTAGPGINIAFSPANPGSATVSIPSSGVVTSMIANDNVTGDKLASEVAGNGLTQDESGNLNVHNSNNSINVNENGISLNVANANTWTATQKFTASTALDIQGDIENTSGTNNPVTIDDALAVTGLIASSDANIVTYNTTSHLLGYKTDNDYAITTVSTATTLDATYQSVLVTASVTITLPTAVGITGKKYIIKNIGTNNTIVSIATTGSQTIDGNPSKTINVQWQGVILQSDGANWYIMGTI